MATYQIKFCKDIWPLTSHNTKHDAEHQHVSKVERRLEKAKHSAKKKEDTKEKEERWSKDRMEKKKHL